MEEKYMMGYFSISIESVYERKFHMIFIINKFYNNNMMKNLFGLQTLLLVKVYF